jgi:hypothetical protein
MLAPFHPLHLRDLPNYSARLAAICAKLADYRAQEAIAWPARVEAWLSNFDGPNDQLAALSMLEKLCVLTHADVVMACRALVARLAPQAQSAPKLFHVAEQPSGLELLNVLQKRAGVRKHQILEPSLFADSQKLEQRVKARGGVVIWDTFNGTGGQLKKVRAKYEPLFTFPSGRPSLYFAFLAGHIEASSLPGPSQVVLWKDDIPLLSQGEQDVCDRYALPAGKTRTNSSYETGALITLPDNPPNNVPLILRAKASKKWHPLLERRETQTP